MMRVLGLKYVGKREEGIAVMLFKSYKTVKITSRKPYKFTGKDRVDDEAINYYKKLVKLGVVLIEQDSEFLITKDRRNQVRVEPLAAELDTQIDITSRVQEEFEDSDSNIVDEVSVSESNNEQIESVITNDKIEFQSMSPEEISEYLEMNFDKDQLRTMISDLGLDISVGRKGVPTLISEIVSLAKLDDLVAYLSK